MRVGVWWWLKHVCCVTVVLLQLCSIVILKRSQQALRGNSSPISNFTPRFVTSSNRREVCLCLSNIACVESKLVRPHTSFVRACSFVAKHQCYISLSSRLPTTRFMNRDANWCLGTHQKSWLAQTHLLGTYPCVDHLIRTSSFIHPGSLEHQTLLFPCYGLHSR